MGDLPAGTVTFLFTDVEGSTDLLMRVGAERYAEVLATHHLLLRRTFAAHRGREVDTQGEGFFVAFPTAADGVAAALAMQLAVASHPWPAGEAPRLRMGLHTGEPVLTSTGYVGMDVHRAARICAAGHGGQVLLSETTANLVQQDLPAGASLISLGEHRFKDLQRPERICQLVYPPLPAAFPPLRSLSATPNNLPVQLTTFVGREKEIPEIRSLLATARLLTLTGAGGCGKTRLALQAVADLPDRFPHGMWLVELGPVTDPTLVPRAVATDLGLRQEPSDMTAALAEHLRNRQAIIILDGCEHLLAECARLAESLLRAAPALRILATSRQRLGILGEITYVVPPLSLPDGQPVRSLQQLEGSDAARLFVERALLSRPDFSPTDAHAESIAQVVHRLDGIPLAIELAAARVKVLSVDQIARRLDDRFRLLIGGARGVLPRQQTLEAAIDWSYDLLSEDEKVLFRRLSVFAGRFSLGAVEAVCAGGRIAIPHLIDLLASLIDQSMMLAEEHAGEMRYRMLETVREYSRKKLALAGEAEAVYDAHLTFFLGLAEEAAPGLRGRQGQRWLGRLDADHDDLRAALMRALSAEGKADELLRLASALWHFWFDRGHWTEGRDWLERALGAHRGAPAIPYARAMSGAAALAWRQGDHERAAALAQAGRDLSASLQDRWGLGFSLLTLGLVARRKDDYARAAALHEESLAIFRALRDTWGIAYSLRLLGIALWHRGSYPRARTLFEESLELCRQMGDAVGIADSMHGLGRTAAYEGEVKDALLHLEESLERYRQLGSPSGLAHTQYVRARVEAYVGEYERAGTLLDESLALFRHVRDEWAIATALAFAGRLQIRLGDPASATRRFQESLALRRRLGYAWDRYGLAEFMEGLGGLALAQRRHEAAARMYGAASAVRAAIGAPLPPIDRAQYDRDLEEIRAALGEPAFRRAWEQGEGLTPEQALSPALLVS